MVRKKQPHSPAKPRSLCQPPVRSARADRQILTERLNLRNPIPAWLYNLKKRGGNPTMSAPLMRLPPDQYLADLGITIQLIGFPAGTAETDLANYAQIVDAFAHCFNPALFTDNGMPDPFAGWPYDLVYWDGLFKKLNQGGLNVEVSNSNGATICFGVTGDVQISGSYSVMQLLDCTEAPDILHEIGHLMMRFGIQGHLPPLYYSYSTGNAGDPSHPNPPIDAIVELNRLFGNYSQKALDIDNLQFGFVSEYATTDQAEDFAETLKYYVYYSDDAYSRAARQAAQQSPMLGEKLAYIAHVYAGMSFDPGGAVASWPGYSL